MKHKITEARQAPQAPRFDQGSTREYGAPGGGGYFWIFFFMAAAIIVATQVKKENPELNVLSDQELFDKLPDDAKEAFKEKYGQPDEDDRECELYYLLAKSTMKRPCAKCPVWCMDAGKTQILVSKGQIYYIGKTCRKRGEREKEHGQIREALKLDYEWIKRGTEGYITTQEQLHLKTYFIRPEARKEGCRLFLPPGNSAGMPQQDWRKLLKELQ